MVGVAGWRWTGGGDDLGRAVRCRSNTGHGWRVGGGGASLPSSGSGALFPLLFFPSGTASVLLPGSLP